MGNITARRRHSAFAAGLATLAMAAGLATVPAQAADKTKYIALGDSFAAGQGAGPYLDDCYRSDNTYSELADGPKAIKLVVNEACSGKTTQDVVDAQLSQLNKSTELVTITAGGNNLGFGAIITYCGVALAGVTPGAECDAATAYAAAQLESGQLYRDLVSMIESVQAAAPNARIVVTGYPYLLDPIPAGLTDPAALFIYQATELADALNGAIAAAAGSTGATYVDVGSAFLGHGALSPDPWINLGGPENPDSFHPNAEGYEAYYAALNAAGAYSAG
ncbi:SGNH/GDSL hydrolase family protein [Arthrobacter sp. AK04]|uniref:SGNH/GDSL hydrolase family protein n=1 Tax=Arthrobacter sp. AK04 TaxID=2900048 RepID=UPI001E4175D1|nr:SGNH/GDSL hydrolase family protein [Arthrobacter sp. AK04]MCD5340798.1 SGNH/GDSL hydrolase family protein [Arthrobacter sp. AK04]